ncbi:MAG: hypothetical protein ACYS5V_14535, partial [Planctomycetota bacterium]
YGKGAGSAGSDAGSAATSPAALVEPIPSDAGAAPAGVAGPSLDGAVTLAAPDLGSLLPAPTSDPAEPAATMVVAAVDQVAGDDPAELDDGVDLLAGPALAVL